MSKRLSIGVSGLAAAALAVSAFSGAFASAPSAAHEFAAALKTFRFNGNIKSNGTVHANKNLSSGGRVYAHGGAQVWKGLLVQNGIKTDGLDVTGVVNAQSATVTGNLQAGAIAGNSLSLTGGATVGGTLSTSGLLTAAGGIDAKSGTITTTGALTADSGTFAHSVTAGSLSTLGTLSAGAATVTGLTVTGPVNFSNAQINFTGAQVTGLNGTSGGSANTLSVGTSTGTSSPLTILENSKSSTIGVDTSGNLVLGPITTTSLAAPSTGVNVNNSGSQSALAISGNPINLTSNTNLTGGSDLTLGTGTNTASHLVANGNTDLAGTVTLNVSNATIAGTDIISSTITFAKAYARSPSIVLTATGDPEPGASSAPKVWVELVQSGSQYTGFKIHYVLSATATSSYSPAYNYIVVGQ